jgi:hypothetical protein
MYFEYFICIVLLTTLGKFEHLLTVSDMLSYFKFDWCTAYGTMSSPHFMLYFQYIFICYFRGRHASRRVNRIVVPLDEFRQYIYVSVRALMPYIFTACREWCDGSLDYRTFQIRVFTYLKLNTLLFQHVFE